MQFELVITKNAENDILQASDWYEKQKNELGKQFMLSIDNYINTIHDNPLAFAIYYSKIRKASTKKFPYSIFYYIDDNKIIIIAVIHNSRYEDVWKKRIT